MAILVFTVTLASSALDAKLQRSSVVEMRKILHDKKKERDTLLENINMKNLVDVRQMKLDADLDNLLKMGTEEVDQAADEPSSSLSAQAAAAPSSSLSAQAAAAPHKLVSCKDEEDDDDDDDEGYKRYLMEEQGLKGAELQEEWLAWKAAHPTKVIGKRAPGWMEPKPKSKLQRVGEGSHKKRPAAAHVKIEPQPKPKLRAAPKMRGSVSAAISQGSTLSLG